MRSPLLLPPPASAYEPSNDEAPPVAVPASAPWQRPGPEPPLVHAELDVSWRVFALAMLVGLVLLRVLALVNP